MSTAAKLTLASTLTATAGIIYLVHRQQQLDQAAMHIGVIRDMERQQQKTEQQRERQLDFEMQRELEERYRKVQNVSDSSNK